MKETNMNFTEALAAMKRGEKVRRASWKRGEYVEINGERTSFVGTFGYERNIGLELILGMTDWEIYKPEPVLNPCCGYIEMCQLKDGMFYVYCAECKMMTTPCATCEEAARVWNMAHTVKPKPKTNFEKFVTPEFIRDALANTQFYMYISQLIGDYSQDDTRKYADMFLEWANATAEEDAQ